MHVLHDVFPARLQVSDERNAVTHGLEIIQTQIKTRRPEEKGKGVGGGGRINKMVCD